jgi:Leucine-rich repeat (LRR) protein
MSYLSDLILSDNLLSSLPSRIGDLSYLTRLYVDRNQLIILPPDLWDLVHLSELALSDNQLTSLPHEIGRLVNLSRLYLDRNPLTPLPSELWNLIRLSDLSLGDIQLTILPPEIQNLANLRYLNLYYNRLASLPSEIGNMVHLSRLYLYGNHFNTPTYCVTIPLIQNNNPGITLYCDPNPNPLTNDCSTDLDDLGVLASLWLKSPCTVDNSWCDGVDLDYANDVTMEDFEIFASLWMMEVRR